MATADLFAPGCRPYTDREEALHALSHGIGVPLALIALWALLWRAEGAREVAGAAVFGLAAVFVYVSSTLYHASWRSTPWQRLFRCVDHAAIYVMIAGTYTPLALLALPPATGGVLLALMWSLAAAGIAVKVLRYNAPAALAAERLSLAFYLAMGWCGALVLGQLWSGMGPSAFAWLLAGGGCFTAGAAVYAMHNRRYAHLIWHFFVMAGTACHVAMLWQVLG